MKRLAHNEHPLVIALWQRDYIVCPKCGYSKDYKTALKEAQEYEKSTVVCIRHNIADGKSWYEKRFVYKEKIPDFFFVK